MDPVARGHVLLDRLFCTTTGSPPAAAVASQTPFEFGMTPRDRLQVHLKDPSCAACHAVMDPLGFAFEGFEANGKSRTSIPTYGNGPSKPVDSTGEITFLQKGPVRFEGSVAFSSVVAEAIEVKQCFVLNLASYSFGAAIFDYDSCEAQEILKAVTSQDGDLSVKRVMSAIANHELFKSRRRS